MPHCLVSLRPVINKVNPFLVIPGYAGYDYIRFSGIILKPVPPYAPHALHKGIYRRGFRIQDVKVYVEGGFYQLCADPYATLRIHILPFGVSHVLFAG